MTGGLGRGFEHVLNLHNSYMADALSKFDWTGGQSAYTSTDCKHQESAEVVNMDVRQVLLCSLFVTERCASLTVNASTSASGPEHS
jgi:hypothetical protein